MKCTSAVVLSLGIATTAYASASFAASKTVIDNSSDPDRALITFPEYTIKPPGKWTIVVIDQKKLKFRSLDGTQHMQIAVLDLHAEPKQTEDDAFRSFVESRRHLERENILNEELKSDSVRNTSDQRGNMASWCIIDGIGSNGHMTAILEHGRRLMVVSYDADKVAEAEFRKQADMVLEDMSLR